MNTTVTTIDAGDVLDEYVDTIRRAVRELRDSGRIEYRTIDRYGQVSPGPDFEVLRDLDLVAAKLGRLHIYCDGHEMLRSLS